jgi:hypothetical protein
MLLPSVEQATGDYGGTYHMAVAYSSYLSSLFLAISRHVNYAILLKNPFCVFFLYLFVSIVLVKILNGVLETSYGYVYS